MGQFLSNAYLTLLVVACSPTGGLDPSEPSRSEDVGTAQAQAGNNLDYDVVFPWASKTAHEMAAGLELQGDWSQLVLQRFIELEPTSGLPRFVFVNGSTVRVEEGDVKYSILRFDIGDSSLVNIVTGEKGLIVNDHRDQGEFERTVNDFADFQSLAPSTAIATARSHLATEQDLDANAPILLVRFEYKYFARPQCLELQFQRTPQSPGLLTVRLDVDGKVLAD